MMWLFSVWKQFELYVLLIRIPKDMMNFECDEIPHILETVPSYVACVCLCVISFHVCISVQGKSSNHMAMNI